MFSEPDPTPYDWNFRIFSIPVRVHILFWVLAAFIGSNLNNGPQGLIMWILAVFISILAHELGHALAIRFYGFTPHIVLYTFGGLTLHERHLKLRHRDEAFISFAGPAAGFLFLGMIISVLGTLVSPAAFMFPLYVLGLTSEAPSIIINTNVTFFILYLCYINIFWGILNLLPIFPLDGGHLCEEFCTWLFSFSSGVYITHAISLITAVALCAWMLRQENIFNAVLFGMLAFSNYQMMTQRR